MTYYYEYAISEGFGTLISHGVLMDLDLPHVLSNKNQTIISREITKAEFEAFGPNRVPQIY